MHITRILTSKNPHSKKCRCSRVSQSGLEHRTFLSVSATVLLIEHQINSELNKWAPTTINCANYCNGGSKQTEFHPPGTRVQKYFVAPSNIYFYGCLLFETFTSSLHFRLFFFFFVFSFECLHRNPMNINCSPFCLCTRK